MGLHIRNSFCLPLFTIIDDITGDLNILYGLELLIPSSGTGTRNCDIHKITGNIKNSTYFDLLKICMKYFCRNTYNYVKTDVPKKHIYLAYNMISCRQFWFRFMK